MMFLLALFAHAQAPVLDAAPAKAGMTCAIAEGVAAGPKDSTLTITSRISYYLMQSALADSGGKKFLDQVDALVNQLNTGDGAKPTPAEAKALLAQCDRRFPKARATAPVKLPADAFSRDVMCLGALGVLMGAAEGMQEDGKDSSGVDRIQPSFNAYGARLTDSVLAEHGIHEDARFKDQLGATLLSSLSIGNIEQIERACTAALPAAKP